MKKELSPKQLIALDYMMDGVPRTYTEIADLTQISTKVLWEWRTQPQFKNFQDEWQRRKEERWQRMEEIAINSMTELATEKHFQASEFILKNRGHNPSLKLEGKVDNTIEVIIGEVDPKTSESESGED